MRIVVAHIPSIDLTLRAPLIFFLVTNRTIDSHGSRGHHVRVKDVGPSIPIAIAIFPASLQFILCGVRISLGTLVFTSVFILWTFFGI